jgi:hypothetical protein
MCYSCFEEIHSLCSILKQAKFEAEAKNSPENHILPETAPAFGKTNKKSKNKTKSKINFEIFKYYRLALLYTD